LKIINFINLKGKKYLLFYGLFTFNFLLFLIFIFTLEPYWAEINLTVSGWIDLDFNIVLVIALLLALPLIYALILLVIHIRRIIKYRSTKPQKLNVILPIIIMLIFNVLMVILIDMLEDYSNVIFQTLEFYAFFTYLGLNILLMVAIFPLVRVLWVIRSPTSIIRYSTYKYTLLLTIIVIGYGTSLLIPFFMVPANVIYRDLPPKPRLIAHRGASYLAPENTLKAGEAALFYDDVVGWEVDIQISYDGIPFLMHDSTLRRTTNVSEQFPSRKNDLACSFTISELKELDAGSWFVEKDPYGTICKGIVSASSAENFKGEQIPTFEEVLNFTRDHNLLLDFDPYPPPLSHPYYDDFYEILINQTIDSGIDLTRLMIPTTNSLFLSLINGTIPEARLGWGGSPSILEYQASPYNYSYVNTGDGYSNAEYRALDAENINVMVWTIESVERYCELWCLGVDWVKTNSPYKFNDLISPTFYLTVELYNSIWILFIIAAISLSILITCKFNKITIKGQ
jgi:glycerophosphoinositol inositolphosphodiesterase